MSVGSNPSAAVDCLPQPADNSKEVKKGGGSASTIIIGPSKSVLVYALHSLEYVLGLARFRMFVPKLYYNIDGIDRVRITFTTLCSLLFSLWWCIMLSYSARHAVTAALRTKKFAIKSIF